MSTNLELKIRLRELEARVKVLEDRQIHPEAVKMEEKNSERKMCPHCGVKPNHFFHVKNCPKKNNNGANEEANR